MSTSPENHFPSRIFNLEKKDYAYSPLFLGEQMGLLDTIHKPHKEIEDYAFRLKALDWSENEFSLKTLKADFKLADKNSADVMLYTLATQWEADTEAARHVVPILAPAITSTELWTYYGEELRNENLHGRVYSNISRESFDDPEQGMREVLARKEALSRLAPVTDIFAQTQIATAKYILGQTKNDQELFNTVFKFIVAKYVMERLQFISSFGATFLTCYDGLWKGALRNVEKICQDELEIHAKVGELIISSLLKTQRGQLSYSQIRNWIEHFTRSVVASEVAWNGFMNQDGRYVPYASKSQMDNLVFWNASVVYKTLGLPLDFDVPKRFPIPMIEDSFNISKTQGSPQEEKTGMYMLGEVIDDVDNGEMLLPSLISLT